MEARTEFAPVALTNRCAAPMHDCLRCACWETCAVDILAPHDLLRAPVFERTLNAL